MFNNIFKGASYSAAAAFGVWQYFQRRNQRKAFAQGRVNYPFFNAGVHNNPKFDKRYKDGEDAYLISESQRMIGVADGVGGWSEVDVCSGICSKFLCRKMSEMFE